METSQPIEPGTSEEQSIPIEPTAQKSQNNFAVPASIIVAGLLIASAVIYSGKNTEIVKNPADAGKAAVADAVDTRGMKPVSSDDHILGNPDAAVKIVEYSDLECPFCKRFHETMNQVMNEYGKSGQVAWIYRHLPLDQLHSKARTESEASECAAKLGGNEKFWVYIDRLFQATPSNNGLDLSLLPEIAEQIGLNRIDFEKCMNDGIFKAKIDESIAEGARAGAQGTPYSIIIGKNGKQEVISGAYPYAQMKSAIDKVLQ